MSDPAGWCCVRPLIGQGRRAGGDDRKGLTGTTEIIGRAARERGNGWSNGRVCQSVYFGSAQDRVVDPDFVDGSREKSAAAENAADANGGWRSARGGWAVRRGILDAIDIDRH